MQSEQHEQLSALHTSHAAILSQVQSSANAAAQAVREAMQAATPEIIAAVVAAMQQTHQTQTRRRQNRRPAAADARGAQLYRRRVAREPRAFRGQRLQRKPRGLARRGAAPWGRVGHAAARN